MALTRIQPSGINSTGNFTFADVTVTGVSNLGANGNIVITGGSNGQALTTDGAGNLSWTTITGGGGNSISNGNSNVSIPAANGNISISVGGNANAVVVTGTGMNVTGYSNVTGNIVGGGNLNIAENAVIGGNLTVSGNLVYIDITDLSVEDPIIQLQRGPNGAAPASNTGKDVGTALNYYDGAAKTAFMGWNVSNAEIALAANVTIANDVISSYTFANVRAGNAVFSNAVTANFFIGSGANLSNIAGANVSGTVANATYAANAGNASVANTAGTVTTAAQPNITSVGTLGSLTITGNVTAGNANLGNAASANFFIGNGSLLTGITAVSAAAISNGNSNVSIPAANGNVTVSVDGNANVLIITGTGANVSGTLAATGNLSAANASLGNVASANFLTGTLTTAAQPNITSVGTLGSLDVTGNITAGNANLGNSATANFYIGNGSLLTGVTSYAIANGNSNVGIPVANGNINFSAEGNANVFVLTGRGAVLTGNIQTGNGTGGNITGANIISAQTINASAALNVTGTSNLGPVGNVTITGGSNGQVLQTNGSGVLTWATVSTSGVSNGNSNVAIPVADGNVNISAAGNANVLVVTGTGANITGTANITGSIVGGGNLNISGNAVIGGNLTVDGNLIYVNVTDLSVEDPIIQLQTGPNGAAPTSNSGKDVGTALNYYDSSAKIAWMGWDTSNAEIAFGANVGISSEVVTFTELANIRAGNAALGNLVAANFITGTLTTASQPNITSLGTLAGLTVSGTSNLGANGNVTITGGSSGQVLSTDGAGNLSWASVSTSGISNGNSNVNIPAANGNVEISAAGNANILVVTGTGANVTGTLNVTGNTTFGGRSNLGPASNVIITGGSNSYVLSTDGAGNLTWIAQSGGGGGGSPLSAIVDVFAGNGVQTTFTLSTAPSNINLTTVSYNGELLLRNSYSISGSNIVFSEAPADASEIEVTTLTGGGSTPGGTNTQVQFNDSGNFSGNNGFTFDKTTTTLTANNFVATSTANLGSVANIIITGGSNGQVLTTNGSGGLSWTTVTGGGGSGDNISNGNSNVSIATAAGNITASVNGNANIFVITGTGANISGTANVTGNLAAGAELNVAGNTVIGGNLTVEGNLIYVNVTDLAVEDPIIQLQTGPNGAPPASNTGKDVGTALNYYDTSAKVAWMGWDVSNAEIAFGSNVTISSEVVTFGNLANIRAASASLSSLAVSGTSNLGAPANVIITGGSANYVLTTDGAGNLSWAAQSGGGGGGINKGVGIILGMVFGG